LSHRALSPCSSAGSVQRHHIIHVQAFPDRNGWFSGKLESFGPRPCFGQGAIGKGDHCHRYGTMDRGGLRNTAHALPGPELREGGRGNAAVILDRAKKVADQVGAQCVTRHIKDEQVSNRSIACVDGGCAACRRVYREFVHQALELRRIGRGKCACGRQSEV